MSSIRAERCEVHINFYKQLVDGQKVCSHCEQEGES